MADLKIIADIINSPELLEVGRLAVEDAMVALRDNRVSVMRNNGMVIKEYSGKNSDVIRMGTEDVLRIGLGAILEVIKWLV